MRAAELTRATLAFLVKDFRGALLSPRLGVVSSLVAAVTLLTAWELGTAAYAAIERGADPMTLHLWERGADGALAALGFLMPAFLPVLPVFLARQNLKSEREGGLLPLAMTKPAVSGAIALGRLVGLIGALAVPVVLISLAAIFLVQLVVGLALDISLAITFLLTNLLLASLYLLLAFATGRGKTPEFVGTLSLLAWIGFSLLRPTAFELLGQIIGALPLGRVVSFEYAWTDTLTFTGLHQGFLANAFPSALDFVTGPTDQIFPLLPWSAGAWIVGLAVLHGFFLRRLSSR